MSRSTLVLIAAAAALAAAGCSSSGSGTASPTSAPPAVTAPAATSAAPAATSAPAAPTAAGLSGKWSGQYSGAFTGTFTLHWVQSSSKLSGTIKLSNPATTVSLHGTVSNNVISFGTVGSTDITYSGTVSGSSMSGTYKVVTSSGSAGGPWSAARA